MRRDERIMVHARQVQDALIESVGDSIKLTDTLCR